MVTNFNEKRKGKFLNKKLAFQLGVILFILATFFLAFVNFRMYEKKKELVSIINFYQEQIKDLEKGNQELKDGIANIDDIDYLEKIAYEQLGQQKPGEKAIIFVAPEQKAQVPAEQKQAWTGWFSGIWNWIKSKF